MKYNRITAVEDNLLLPVFWQTPCYMQADLSNEMVLIEARGLGSVCKPQRGTKVSVVSGFCVPLYLFVGFCDGIFILSPILPHINKTNNVKR